MLVQKYDPDYKLSISITVDTKKGSPKDPLKVIEEVYSALLPLADEYQIEFFPILAGKEASLEKQG